MKSLCKKSSWVKITCKKKFLGEEALGEKYMGEKYVQEEFLKVSG